MTEKFQFSNDIVNQIQAFVLSLLMLIISGCSAAQSSSLAGNSSDENYCRAIPRADALGLSSYLAPYESKLKDHTGTYILEQGTEAMLSRAWLSEQAEYSIDVQYFIFSADNIGLIATDFLVRAAERGVKVRVLVDDIMVDANGHELLKLAAHENFSIKIYNPMANIGKNIVDKVVNLTTDFHRLNQRMHNKTFTVDGKVSITGGRNIADEYFGYDHQYNFRDRDVLLLGGASTDIQSSFEQFWHSDLSMPIEKIIKSEQLLTPDYDNLHEYACNPLNFVPKVRDQINDIPEAFLTLEESGKIHWLKEVEYISDIPGKNDGSQFLSGGGLTTTRLIELAKTAKKSLTIQTPYLVTTDLSRDLFRSLVKKGIVINILTNSLASNDNLEAFSGYQRDRKALLATGVKIYEFKPDAKIRQKVMSDVMQKQLDHMPIFGLHAKSMVIDDDVTIVGTFNVDPRSANLNTESITVIPSKEISAYVKQGMLEEMKPENAWQTTLDWNPDGEVSRLKQLRVKLRRLVPKNIL